MIITEINKLQKWNIIHNAKKYPPSASVLEQAWREA